MLSVALNFDREISPLYVEIFSLRKTKILAEEIKVEKLLLIHEAVMGNLSFKKRRYAAKGCSTCIPHICHFLHRPDIRRKTFTPRNAQMKTKRIGRQSCKTHALLGKTKICVKNYTPSVELNTECRTTH